MSVQLERLDHNMAKLTIEVPASRFDEAVQKAYLKMRGRINLPGFRKGKAPRKMIERMYGAAIFFEDAANLLIPEAYQEALKEVEEEIVSQPEIDITQLENGKPFIFTAQVAVKPEVELGQYKGVEVEETSIEVTEEEIQKEIDREREANSRMIDVDDRPVEDGDIVKLDFDGSVDGVPFEGGKANDYPLTIGSGSFIPGFEEQLIGMNIGEEKDVTVTFPADYHAEELQGKEAVFACRIGSIARKELPEVDDEFAQDVSEFETLEEYREDLERQLRERKEEEAKRAKETAVVDKIVENCTIDIPDAMIDEQIRRMIDEFEQRVSSQGLSMEQYMQFTGMTEQALREQMRPEAIKRIQNSLVLEAVAKAEGIETSDEKLEEELAKMAESYKMEADKLRDLMGEEGLEQMRADLAIQAAVDMVCDMAVEVPKKSE